MSVLIYKDNIMEKIGGESHFDYVIMTYCESIREDSSLNLFFAHLDLNGLTELQTEFLNASLLDTSLEETLRVMGRLAVKYQMLWKMGMNEYHFEQLKAHFVMALKESWVEEGLTQVAEKHFDSLRSLFQQSVKFVLKRSPSSSVHRKTPMRNFNRAGATTRSIT